MEIIDLNNSSLKKYDNNTTNNYDFMFFVCITVGVIIIGWGVYLQISIFKKKKSFPYKNINTIWQICNTFTIIFFLLVILLEYILNKLELKIDKTILSKWLYLLTNLYMHYIFLLPNLTRCYYYYYSLRYHYHHLTSLSYEDNADRKSINDFELRFTNKRDSYIFKLLVIPLFIAILIISILCIPNFTNCCLINLNTYNLYLLADCNDEQHISVETAKITILIGIFLFVIESLCFITLIVVLYRYSIKDDTFYIRTELTCIFVIWYLSHLSSISINLYISPSSSKDEKVKRSPLSIDADFFYEMGTTGCYLILYSTLMYLRDKIKGGFIIKILTNFELFLHNRICFNFFMQYVKENHQEDMKYLMFWLDANIFKRKAHEQLTLFKSKNRISIDSNDEKKISSKENYLYNITSDNFLSGSSSNPSSPVNIGILPKSFDDNFEVLKSEESLSPVYDEQVKECFEKLREVAAKIVSIYFVKSNSQNSSMALDDLTKEIFKEKQAFKIKNNKNTSCDLSRQIDFPSEIREKIDEYNSNDFECFSTLPEFINFKNIFDEALIYSFNKLYDKYLSLCNNEKAFRQVETLVFFFDFCEIKEFEV